MAIESVIIWLPERYGSVTETCGLARISYENMHFTNSAKCGKI